MASPIILGAKLQLKRSELMDVDNKLKDLLAKRDELAASVEGIESEGDLQAVEAQADEIEKDIEETEEKKKKLIEVVEEIEKEIDEGSNKKPQGGERGMQNNIEVRDAINAYVRSKGQTREGFTSVEGGALIPVELLAPQKVPTDVVNLQALINTKSVNSSSGKYPVIAKSGSKMTAVAELVKNPALANPTFTEVNYDIETYRGYIPVSQEIIDDANYDITGLIAEEIKDQGLNTKNAAIAEVLKSATAKTVTGLDGIKELINKGIKKVYNVKIIASASLYNELDKMKDNDGRYLLQRDITLDSGYRLFGKELVVVDDTMIGSAEGDLKAFIGDAKAFATFFNRNATSVKWIDSNIYGQLLASFIRFDVVKTDANAGFYVTYTPAVPGA